MSLSALSGAPLAGASTFFASLNSGSTFHCAFDHADTILGESEYIAPFGVYSRAMDRGGGGGGISDVPAARLFAGEISLSKHGVEKKSPEERWPEHWNKLLEGDVGQRFLVYEMGIYHPVVDAFIESLWDSQSTVAQPTTEHRIAMLRLKAYESTMYPPKKHIFSTIDDFRSASNYVLYKKRMGSGNTKVILERLCEMMKYPGIDRYTRRLMVDMANLVLSNSSIDEVLERFPQVYINILRPALRSGDLYTIYSAFNTLRKYSPAIAGRIGGDELGDVQPIAVGLSPEFGIEKYLYRSNGVLSAIRAMYLTVMVEGLAGQFDVGEAHDWSIAYIKPLHSLADFQPNLKLRSPVMWGKYQSLKEIVAEVGMDRREVFRRYFGGVDHAYGKGKEWPSILGFDYLMQGHHRIAALIEAAVSGLVPFGWLHKIPFRIYSHPWPATNMMENLFMTGGVELEWADLFPGGIYRDTIKDAFDRLMNGYARKRLRKFDREYRKDLKREGK
jgi:hypothetical protein